jgi:hypothetical protein
MRNSFSLLPASVGFLFGLLYGPQDGNSMFSESRGPSELHVVTIFVNKPTVVKQDMQENQSLEIVAILGMTKIMRGDIITVASLSEFLLIEVLSLLKESNHKHWQELEEGLEPSLDSQKNSSKLKTISKFTKY